jgi:MYXO-CTERM domain-containing protein
MMLAAAAGVTFAASHANADTSASGGPNSSTGSASLHYDKMDGLDTTIDTGFIGPSVAQVRAVVKIDPIEGGDPLYSIDMPNGAVVEASWSGDKKIVLKAKTGPATGGTVKVHHTLTPSLELKVSAFGLSAQFAFDATEIANKLPGAKFAYDSQAQSKFAPWGFTTVNTLLSAPDLDDSVLFSEPFSVFGDILDPADWAGSIGIRATTKPTFAYKTTKVMLTGADAAITTTAGESVIPAPDADFMDLTAQTEGAMDVTGTMDIQPFVSITKAFGSSISISPGITAYSAPYTVPTEKIVYQAVVVHVPLPNVHVPTAGVDLGTVKSGGTATKTVTIQNSGEMAATMTFKSSDGQFTVPSGSVTIPPKGSYDMELKFAPSGGAASADITVASNDPDSPEQIIKVGANGADVTSDDPTTNDPSDTLPSATTADSGCGCKTAGTTTSTGGWAGIGLLALGMTVAARRRKNGKNRAA